jgi:uncharacterized membrane protein YjdF
MKFKKGEIIIAIFNLIYIIGFSIYYFSKENYEFLLYIGVIVLFFLIIGGTIRKTNLSYLVLIGLSLWGFLHMIGGGVKINGEVFYSLVLIPLVNNGDIIIFKFDQFVHIIGFGVATLFGWELLKPKLKDKISYPVIYFLIFLIGLGFGAVNEIVEFIAVVFIPETGVGGYYNTGLDLVSNAIGALIAIGVIHFKELRNK